MKVNLHTFSDGSVIFDQCHMVWRAVAIKLQHMWMCLSHSRGDEGMTCQVIKSLACIEFYVANNSIEDQLNRFLALHALVEGLGIC